MGTLKILNASGHATLTEENTTVSERRSAFDQAIRERKVPFDQTTKERIDPPVFSEERDVLMVPPIQGGC